MNDPSCESLISKLATDLEKYKKDLVRFKREKLDRVNANYSEHRVYRWLTGEGQPWRSSRRVRINKPFKSTIDVTSGESASDNESLIQDTSKPQGNIQTRSSFLQPGLGLIREPVTSGTTNPIDRGGDALGGARGEANYTRAARGRPPRRRT